jgi:chromosome partitioning protein
MTNARIGPRTIAVTNGKGGVGKTTTTSHVAALAAAAGHRVLVVDLDPQANIGEDLGYTDTDIDDGGASLVAAVLGGGATTPTTHTVRDNLDVIVAGDALDDLADMLAGRQRRDGSASMTLLSQALAPLIGNYSLVLLDCPPRHEVLEVAALAAARWVLIPTHTDASSIKGLRRVAKKFSIVRTVNPDLELLGVVMYGSNPSATRIRAEVRAELEEVLQESAPVFNATVRHTEAAAYDIRKRGQLAHELERALSTGDRDRAAGQRKAAKASSGLAGDFEALAPEVITTLLAQETGAAA